MDTTPIVARLSVIAESVQGLQELQQLSYDEWQQDFLYRTSTERLFQLAIQAAIDIGSFILATKSSPPPRSYKEIFQQLGTLSIIPHKFADKLAQMAGFRNILVHLYMEVDDEKVYQFLQEDLPIFDQFTQYIGQYLAEIDEE